MRKIIDAHLRLSRNRPKLRSLRRARSRRRRRCNLLKGLAPPRVASRFAVATETGARNRKDHQAQSSATESDNFNRLQVVTTTNFEEATP